MSLATASCGAHTCQTALMIGVDQLLERLLRKQLDDRNFQVITAVNTASALAALGAKCFDLVLVAEELPEGRGIEFIRQTAKRFVESRFVLVGNGEQLRTVVDAVRSGAHDFLPLPLEPDGVRTLLERLGNGKRREYDLERQAADDFENIITISPALKRAIAEARQVAPFDAPVLLLGDSGTGKELFARAIHGASRRARSPLVALNCANLPEALLESQLFGHVRGAFTGADQSHAVFVGEAAGGTLTVPASEWLYATCCSTRARVWLTIVVVWCIVAFFSGLVWSAIHFLLLLRHPPWTYVLLAAAPPALASAGMVWVLLAAWSARHEAIEQRQADLHEHLSRIIHLNDRVRNALQATTERRTRRR